MAKRFTETDIWNKQWFQELNLKQKILLKYIFENCDCAGVWEMNFRLASFVIGETVTLDDIQEINNKKQQFEILDNGNLWVIDFIKFQYGKISENCKPHIPVINKLKKYNLFERVSKGYPKGTYGNLEEKEKEKEKEKEIYNPLNKDYKEKENLIKEKESFFNPDSFCSTKTDELFSIYKANCKNLIPIRYEKRNRRIQEKIQNFLEETNADMALFNELCEKANNLEKIANSKIDFEMMLNCYVGILNGKYESNAPPERPVLTRESILKMIRDE